MFEGRGDGSAAAQTRAEAPATGERGEDTEERLFPHVLFSPPLCEGGHITELIAANEQGDAQLDFMKHPFLSFSWILLQVPKNCYLHGDRAANGPPTAAPREKITLLLPFPRSQEGTPPGLPRQGPTVQQDLGGAEPPTIHLWFLPVPHPSLSWLRAPELWAEES